MTDHLGAGLYADERIDDHAQRVVDEPGADQGLIMVLVALLSLGAIMVYSATIAGDRQTLNTNFSILGKHLLHIALGFVLLYLVSKMKLEWLQSISKKLLVLSLILLALILIPGLGTEVNGSMRWFSFGSLRFQPSELAKIAAVIYFADYLSRKSDDLHLFKVGIVNIGIVVGVIGLGLIMEPDFGTTVVIAVTAACMMFLAGVRFWHFILSSGIATALMAALLWMEPYRVVRLMSYRDPWADPFDSGFQLSRALIAIGRGEWFGAGLGSSIQKLFYLPHAGNDFLIAIIGEELGAAGIIGVLLLFAFLLYRTFVVAARALNRGHRFAGFLAQGIGLLFALQASVHIGVNTGLLPTKGLTLPFMSYGGSSMVCSMAAFGIVLAVDRTYRTKVRKPS